MEAYFLLTEDTKKFPKNNVAPKVRFLSSILPSQSASSIGLQLILSYFSIPHSILSCPWRYLKILFTTMTWLSWGKSWNLATRATTYIMFGLEAMRYNKIPMIYLYLVLFTIGVSFPLHNLQPITIVVLTELQSSSRNFFKVSRRYLDWEINTPFFTDKFVLQLYFETTPSIYI